MISNVDPKEIQKFDQHAKDWWDPNGSMKLLHQINPLRLKFILDHMNIAEKRVLDVGCGAGLLSEAMAMQSADVTGIDLSEAAVASAKAHAQKRRVLVNYDCKAIEDLLMSEKNSFDVITCMEMLEHVPDPSAIVTACAQLLKPGGKLFISTINRNLKSYLSVVIGAEYLLRLLPLGTHDYQKFIKPSELRKFAQLVDLHLSSLKGIKYHFLSSKFLLTDDISTNYLACYEK